MLGHTFLLGLEKANYLCLGGCGTRGALYLGILSCLQKNWPGYKAFQNRLAGAVGSSSGALCALAFLIDADADKLCEAGKSLGLNTVARDMDVSRLFREYGLDSGETLREIIHKSLSEMGLSTQMTFNGLFRLTGKDFVVCATNLLTQKAHYFRKTTTPDLPIASALYFSMCIPFVFRPEKFDGGLFVDGGLTNNVPINVFEPSQTCILHMTATDPVEISDWKAYALAVASCSFSAQHGPLLHQKDLYPELVHDLSCLGIKTTSAVSLDASEEYLDTMHTRGFCACICSIYPELYKLINVVLLHVARRCIQDDFDHLTDESL